jgi:hypothetical protein
MTLMDCTTRWPVAVPLANITTGSYSSIIGLTILGCMSFWRLALAPVYLGSVGRFVLPPQYLPCPNQRLPNPVKCGLVENVLCCLKAALGCPFAAVSCYDHLLWVLLRLAPLLTKVPPPPVLKLRLVFNWPFRPIFGPSWPLVIDELPWIHLQKAWQRCWWRRATTVAPSLERSTLPFPPTFSLL